MAQNDQIDMFSVRDRSGRLPGVVPMAATCDGVAYEGAFGRRALPDGGPP